MVKKVDNEWTTVNVLNSSALIRKYVDLCKDWIIAHDSIPVQPVQFYNIAPRVEHFEDNPLGLDEISMRHSSDFVCYFCKQHKTIEDRKSLVANPFTRLQFMLICTECHNDL
jgi:hypothetical protein